MKIIVLGSGTAAPRLSRNMASYLFEMNNKKILFDSGPGTIRQLLKLKISLLDIDHIFYTHFHNDHINDLPAIIWSNNYGNFRKKTLNLYGPKGFKKYYKILMDSILQIKKQLKLSFKVNINEMKDDFEVKINNIIIKAKKTKHTENGIAYRIEYNNKAIVYSGDTDFSDEIIEIAKDADLLILECSFPDEKKVKGHLTPSLAGIIARKAKVKKLVLTHFYPECDFVDMKAQCAKELKVKIVLAKDFLSLKI